MPLRTAWTAGRAGMPRRARRARCGMEARERVPSEARRGAARWGREPKAEHRAQAAERQRRVDDQGGLAEDVLAQRWRLLASRRAVQAATSAQRGDLHAHAVGDLRRPTRYFVSSPQTTHGRGSLCSLARSPLVPGSMSARLIEGDLVERDDGAREAPARVPRRARGRRVHGWSCERIARSRRRVDSAGDEFLSTRRKTISFASGSPDRPYTWSSPFIGRRPDRMTPGAGRGCACPSGEECWGVGARRRSPARRRSAERRRTCRRRRRSRSAPA